jgi:hypothetical protein
MVNRLWQYHFGTGLVRTPSDFGKMGERPTHPEILDWLASEFIAGGWRLKRMHRMILLSSTWQQSSAWREEAAVRDPENRYLWRMSYRRLEAEPVRDAMLAVSGQLNADMGGPSIYPALPAAVLAGQGEKERAWGKSSEEAASRRSVYVFVKRSLGVPLLEVMDGADPSTNCARRNVTTIAPQALALMNNDFVRRQADRFAARVRKEAGPSPVAKINRAYWLALSRAPRAPEVLRGLRFLQSQRSLVRPSAGQAEGEQAALADFCQVLFNLNEFVYLD